MDEQTIHTYNKRAKEYDDETASFWDMFPSTFIQAFKSKDKARVLSVGSGPGRDALLLKERGFEVVCLDASEAMVEMCQEKGFETIKGDALSIPFPDEKFTHVWAYTSLLHLKKADIGKALQEIRRVLAHDGLFACGMIEGDDETYKISSGIDLPRLFSYYTKGELETLFEDNGFSVIHFESYQPRSKNYLNFIARKDK